MPLSRYLSVAPALQRQHTHHQRSKHTHRKRNALAANVVAILPPQPHHSQPQAVVVKPSHMTGDNRAAIEDAIQSTQRQTLSDVAKPGDDGGGRDGVHTVHAGDQAAERTVAPLPCTQQ